eukprot:10822147-Karenia_brevis.AAC.1
MANCKVPRSKDDWMCKHCTGTDGQPFRNFGTRTSCKMCSLHKGVCFKAAVKKSCPSERRFPASTKPAVDELAALKKE